MAQHYDAISIHAPRTGSDAVAHGWSHGRKISIHAPRTGSDKYQRPSSLRTSGYFNPRSPHGERPTWCSSKLCTAEFQSTLPARGATPRRDDSIRAHNFNPRSPHGERLCPVTQAGLPGNFNPRSPHGERLGDGTTLPCRQAHFNPRSPHGERQLDTDKRRLDGHISIHAPRTGSDRQRRRNDGGKQGFQSTLPARGAT